jgi:hypothetical protein
MQRPYIRTGNVYEDVVRYILRYIYPLIVSGMGLPEILAFSLLIPLEANCRSPLLLSNLFIPIQRDMILHKLLIIISKNRGCNPPYSLRILL